MACQDVSFCQVPNVSVHVWLLEREEERERGDRGIKRRGDERGRESEWIMETGLLGLVLFGCLSITKIFRQVPCVSHVCVATCIYVCR